MRRDASVRQHGKLNTHRSHSLKELKKYTFENCCKSKMLLLLLPSNLRNQNDNQLQLLLWRRVDESYQEDEVEDVENPFEEENTTTVVIGATDTHRPHTRVATHSVF